MSIGDKVARVSGAPPWVRAGTVLAVHTDGTFAVIVWSGRTALIFDNCKDTA